MNIEKIKQLRETVQAAEDREFNMGPWARSLWRNEMPDYEPGEPDHECGTVACLAGHTVLMEGHDAVKMERNQAERGGKGVGDAAQCVLGLTDDERAWMFMGHWIRPHVYRTHITRAEALRYLDKVIESGNVMVTVDRI